LSGQDALGLQFGDGLVGRPTAIKRDLLRDLVIADRFFEEAYGGRSIPIFTQQEIYDSPYTMEAFDPGAKYGAR
jgi:hypothetical protein